MLKLINRRSFLILLLSPLIAGCEGSPEERAQRAAKVEAYKAEVDTEQEKYHAYEAAKSFVSNKLASPGSAVFQDYDDSSVTISSPGLYQARGYVDSQNSFGALLRSGWAVKFHKTDDTYTLDEIAVKQRE